MNEAPEGGRAVIRTTCAHCGREHEAADDLAGMRVRCRFCDGWIRLPETPTLRPSVSATAIAPQVDARPVEGSEPSLLLPVYLPAVAVADPPPPQAITDLPTLPFASQADLAEIETEVFCPQCGIVNTVRKRPGPQEVVCVRCGLPFTMRPPPDLAPAVLPATALALLRRGGYNEEELAHPWRRVFGAIFDTALISFPVSLLLIGLRQNVVPEEVMIGVGLLGLLLVVYYQVYLLAANGQTLGKRILAMRIVRVEDATNPGFVRAVLLRTCLPALVYAIPLLGTVLLVISLFCLFGRTRRTLHDRLAGTVVLEE
jgi:uncharacterized RDD family membrane protein YckC